MNLFFHPEVQLGSTITLDAAEATHLVKSLRCESGDEVNFTDGRGGLFRAVLNVGRRSVDASVVHAEHFPRAGFELEIAIAPTKNQERLEWFIEKAVEIGIARITLIHCRHSEKAHLKEERIQRVAIAAMKQSLKVYLPLITSLVPFTDWMKGLQTDQKFIAHCKSDIPRLLLKNAIVEKTSVAIAIGPEGDFSNEEVAMALNSGFRGVSLGDSRLRTETAALAAVHTFEIINQRQH